MSLDEIIESRYQTCKDIFVGKDCLARQVRTQTNWAIGIYIIILLAFLGWAASVSDTVSQNKTEIKSVRTKTDKLDQEISKSLERIEKAVIGHGND